MPQILQYILIAVAAALVLAIVLKLFKFGFKTILKFVINAAVGIAVIFLLNLIPASRSRSSGGRACCPVCSAFRARSFR